MSELTKALATPHHMTHNGKSYVVKLIDKDAKAAWSRRLYQVARDAVKDMKREMDLTTDEYVGLLNGLSEKNARGDFDFNGKFSLSVLNSVKGQCCMLAILTGASEDEAEKLLLENTEECSLLLAEVYKESFPGIKFKVKEPAEKKA